MKHQYNKLRQEYINLHLEDVIDYEKFCILSIMWHSTKIEGCSLSETDSNLLIEKDITAQGKPLQEHLMLKDHFAAYEFIIEQAKLKRKFSISFIQETASILMKNTGGIRKTALGEFDISKGDLRLAQVYVDKKYFPDFSKVPTLLEQFCESVNSRIDKTSREDLINLSADVHYKFVNIHPFGDGNGRMARLLMNYVQLYYNEPLIKIFTEDRSKYIYALNQTEANNDLQIFRQFIMKQHIKFLKTEISKYNKMKHS